MSDRARQVILAVAGSLGGVVAFVLFTVGLAVLAGCFIGAALSIPLFLLGADL